MDVGLDPCYQLGRSLAYIRGANFEMSWLLELSRSIGVGAAQGSRGVELAMLGAFDEFKRQSRIFDTRFQEERT